MRLRRTQSVHDTIKFQVLDDRMFCLAGKYEQEDSVAKLEILLEGLAGLKEDCSIEVAKVESLLPQAQAVAPTSYQSRQITQRSRTQRPLSLILPNMVPLPLLIPLKI